MFEPFLLVGGLLFWIFAAVLGVILLALVENDRGSVATGVLAIGAVIFMVWGNFSLFGWIANNTLEFLMYLVGYFVLGVVWTISKWFFYLLARRDEATDFKASFCQTKGLNVDDEMGETIRKNFVDELVAFGSGYNDRTFPPSASYHKAAITRWAAYWPLSAFWTLMGDGLKRIWDFIYVQIAALLQRLSVGVFKKI